MYDFEWHKLHGAKTSASATKALTALRRLHPFASVLDVGCGDGRWLAAARLLGADEIQGVDGPWTERDRLLIPPEAVAIRELSGALDLGRRFDLAISLEVAEHVEEAFAEQFVDNLVRHADVVLFGAAIPFQGGFRHVNERWQSYWAARFDTRGYRRFDPLRARLWNDPEVHYWYRQNMLVYVNRAAPGLVERFEAGMAAEGVVELPTDLVHPEKYEAIASYREIAFKPLLKALPSRTLAKARGYVPLRPRG
jgi:SAM-dependent methyltransferase